MQTKGLGFSAVLLVAGEAPSAAQLAAFVPLAERQSLYWVAADGGGRLAARYGVPLQAIVGDFDSIPNAQNQPQGLTPQLIRSGTAKDESDRNLAVEYLHQQGHRKIVQVGGGAQRSDHFLAMIYDYQCNRLPVLPKLWLTGYEAIFYLQAGEQLQLSWPQDAASIAQSIKATAAEPPLVSAFPLTAYSRLYSRQLKWPLDTLDSLTDPDRSSGDSSLLRLPYSLSNWAASSTATIEAKCGAALVFCPYVPHLITQHSITQTQSG